METELKFEIDAECAARLRLRLGLSGDGRRLRSVYYDTPDLALKSEGFVLRVRHKGDGWVQGIKKADRGRLFSRHEWETTLSSGALDFEAIDKTPLGKVLTPERRTALQAAFEVDVIRTQRDLDVEGAVIEVALDEGEVRADGRRTPIHEIEFELKKGDPAALFALARDLDCKCMDLCFVTKSARGFALAAGEAPGAVGFRYPPLRPDQTAAEGFRAIAAAALAQIAVNAAVLRLHRNGEALHQLRVGLRHLRSAISLFEPLMSPGAVQGIKGDLRWLARACDSARDLDVFMEGAFAEAVAGAPNTSGLTDLTLTLENRRNQAHVQARHDVGERRFRTLMLETAAWVEAGDWADDPERADLRATELKSFAQDLLERARHRVAKRAKALDAPDQAERHRLRVACKTLRYAAAYFAPVFDKAEAARDYVRLAGAAQDVLGGLTDIVSSEALCAEMASGPNGAPAQAFAAGYLAGRLNAGEAAALKASRKAVRKLLKAEPFW